LTVRYQIAYVPWQMVGLSGWDLVRFGGSNADGVVATKTERFEVQRETGPGYCFSCGEVVPVRSHVIWAVTRERPVTCSVCGGHNTMVDAVTGSTQSPVLDRLSRHLLMTLERTDEE